jgi:hypothetical protein
LPVADDYDRGQDLARGVRSTRVGWAALEKGIGDIMAAAGSPGDLGHDELVGSSANTVGTPATTRELRSVGVGSVAAFGALFSGLIVLIQGIIAVVELGFRLGQAGFIDTWARGILYAGRSLVGLIIVVVIAAIIGAIVWAIAALLYNWIAGAVGGIKLTFK